MRCPSCSHENPDPARFCGNCGISLSGHTGCAACGEPNATDLKFCRACGAPLAAPEGVDAVGGGRYELRDFLGEGGRKRVYLAHDSVLDRNVAVAIIKTDGLDENGLERIRREAQAMARLGDHPNIVTVHDIGEEAGRQFIVSEYMAGGSVEDMLAKTDDNRLPLDRALRIGAEIASALAHAHDRGIVHRDLKPRNVWLSAGGLAKLGDFGLARALDSTRLTLEGMMVGTVAYMAPEQATGREVDHRADLYALGAVLYEMTTGRPPFVGEDAASVISQHLTTPPVAPSWHNPAVAGALEDVILALLDKDPARRPASAAGVEEVLR
ncbi:MAG: serine/threonine-protein kinase, partial [Actinomycetota bacterium]